MTTTAGIFLLPNGTFFIELIVSSCWTIHLILFFSSSPSPTVDLRAESTVVGS